VPTTPKLNRGTLVASAALAAGVAGTVADPNGPVGITLFGVAAAAALFLIVSAFRKPRWRFPTAPKHLRHRTLAKVVRGRTVTIVVAAMGVLFTLWLTTDLARPLVYATWWGFCLLAAWLTAVALLTARRSLHTAA
jgi:hypothetical protein